MKRFLLIPEGAQSLEDAYNTDSVEKAYAFAKDLVVAGSATVEVYELVTTARQRIVFDGVQPDEFEKPKAKKATKITRKPWANGDQELLESWYQQGKSIDEIAKALGRTKKAVYARLNRTLDGGSKEDSVKQKDTESILRSAAQH